MTPDESNAALHERLAYLARLLTVRLQNIQTLLASLVEMQSIESCCLNPKLVPDEYITPNNSSRTNSTAPP